MKIRDGHYRQVGLGIWLHKMLDNGLPEHSWATVKVLAVIGFVDIGFFERKKKQLIEEMGRKCLNHGSRKRDRGNT